MRHKTKSVNSVKCLGIALLCLFFTACKLIVMPVGGGTLTSASGENNCSAGMCEFDANSGFTETYTAVAGQGFIFDGWEGWGPCATTGDVCAVAIPLLPESILALNMDITLKAKFIPDPEVQLESRVNYYGQLDYVLDLGGAVYSGVPVGTNVFGWMDDSSYSGTISDGKTQTVGTCCIEARGLIVGNDLELGIVEILPLNSLDGPVFSIGQLVDGINIETDVMTESGGRFEFGINYLFDESQFSDDSLTHYPPNPDNITLASFYIAEYNEQGTLIYGAAGQLDEFPLPQSGNDEAM